MTNAPSVLENNIYEAIQLSGTAKGCPARKQQIEELKAALRNAVADGAEMTLDQFKTIIWTWIVKHYPQAEPYKDKIMPHLENAFKRVDKDESGTISKEELEAVLGKAE